MLRLHYRIEELHEFLMLACLMVIGSTVAKKELENAVCRIIFHSNSLEEFAQFVASDLTAQTSCSTQT